MNLSTNRFSTIVGTFSIVVAYFYLSTFWQDISFWDESIFYLHGSRSFSFASFLFGAEYGPLYLAWYKTLGFFAEDPVLLYLLSWVAIVVCYIPVLHFSTSPRYYIYALLMLFSFPVFRINPHANLFAGLVILAGYGFARSHFTRDYFYEVAATSALVAGFVRPEYFYITPIVLLSYCVNISVTKQCRLITLVALSLIVAASAFIVIKSTTGRSGVAFEQHFNLRQHEKGLLKGNPWTANYARDVFSLENKPNHAAPTIGTYLKANPMAFAGHIYSNLTDKKFLLFSLLWLALLCLLYRLNSSRDVAFLMLFSIPIFAVSLLIYPRNHYFVTMIPTFMAMLVNASEKVDAAGFLERHKMLKLTLISVLLLVLVTSSLLVRSSLNYGAVERISFLGFGRLLPHVRTDSNLFAITQLREAESRLNLKTGRHQMFDTQGGFYVYLKNNWSGVDESDAEDLASLALMIDGHAVEMFLIDKNVTEFYGTDLAQLDERLGRAGYIKYPIRIKASNVYILGSIYNH